MAVNLKSKSARAALQTRREPYWHCVRVGLYLGFRRTAEGDGTWIGRQLQPGSKKYLLRSFGALPGGYEDALKALDAWASDADAGASHRATTVSQACKAYVIDREAHASKKNADDARGRFTRLVYERPIGAVNFPSCALPRFGTG